MSFKFRLHYWPALATSWFCVTFLTSYLVAVLNQHVGAFLPFISDTGTLAPESCIFGQMLNIASIIMLITLYIKYREVEINTYDNPKFEKWNHWSAFFGTLACLGMSFVANFQETNVLVVHIIGAFMVFVVGTIYFMIQTWITWMSTASRKLKYSRIVLSSLLIPVYVVSMVFGGDMCNDKTPPFIWGQDNDGYDRRLIAAISEWVMAILISLYILTFTSEFKTIEFEEITFVQSNKCRH